MRLASWRSEPFAFEKDSFSRYTNRDTHINTCTRGIENIYIGYALSNDLLEDWGILTSYDKHITYMYYIYIRVTGKGDLFFQYQNIYQYQNKLLL